MSEEERAALRQMGSITAPTSSLNGCHTAISPEGIVADGNDDFHFVFDSARLLYSALAKFEQELI